MKSYRVNVYYNVTMPIVVDAENEEEARQKAIEVAKEMSLDEGYSTMVDTEIGIS